MGRKNKTTLKTCESAVAFWLIKTFHDPCEVPSCEFYEEKAAELIAMLYADGLDAEQKP